MPLQQNVQTAVAHLRNASQDCLQVITEIKNEISQNERESNAKTNELRTIINTLEHELGRPEREGERAQLNREIVSKTGEISDVEHRHAKFRDDKLALIRQYEMYQNDLNRFASQIEQQINSL